MQPFRVLEHTDDIGFEAWGATREEVFANSARALMDLMVDLESIEVRETVAIRLKSRDLPSLLVDWLSEILYLWDTQRILLRDFDIAALDPESLAAEAKGEKFDSTRHRIKLLVKAVTYHQLLLEETASGWRARVYVDI